MYKIFVILLIGLLMVGCKKKSTDNDKSDQEIRFNQALVDELAEIKSIDQLAASNAYPPEKYSHLNLEEWKSFKDSVFTVNQKRAEQIFREYGFVGFNMAGEEGSTNFWLIVQHSDHDPEFQEDVLRKMKAEVEKGNADSRNYALLVDRIKLNTGQAQVYGTQVDYNMEVCQAFPRNLADSINVNKRRNEMGLESLEEYLNSMTIMNFEMNKEFYAKKGVTEPKLYKLK